MNANEEKLVLTPRLREFVKDHEIHCVADCCGAKAFAIEGEPIKAWVIAVGAEVCERVLKDLEELIQAVSESKAEKIVSGWEDIKETWTPQEWVEWLQRWVVELKRVQQMTPEELARHSEKEQEPLGAAKEGRPAEDSQPYQP